MLGQGISLLSRGVHPFICHHFIAHVPEAVLIHHGKTVLGLVIAGFGQWRKEFERLGKFFCLEGGNTAYQAHIGFRHGRLHKSWSAGILPEPISKITTFLYSNDLAVHPGKTPWPE